MLTDEVDHTVKLVSDVLQKKKPLSKADFEVICRHLHDSQLLEVDVEQGHVVDDVLVHGVPGRQRPVQLPHLCVRPAALAVEVAAEVEQAGGVLEIDRWYRH